jgi:hypothetical protein
MPHFNHQAAVAYARRWAQSANPQYPPFGEDCTNFVSQAMLAGGWTMVGGDWFDDMFNRMYDSVWWYGQTLPVFRASYTWSGAPNFARWIVASQRGVRAKNPMELQPGDVLQIRVKATGVIGHSMVVTGKRGTDLLLSAHSNPRLDKSFHEIVAMSSGVEFIPWTILPIFPARPPAAPTLKPVPAPTPNYR